MTKPIFVVGAPRSGTSILTWCLGQHSNIFVQEESDWLGRFSLDLEVAYDTGTRRGERSQLGSLRIERAAFFSCFGDAINSLILDRRHLRARKAREEARANPAAALAAFQIERSDSDAKARWVDGTPEYSFYICALRKLFPDAVFIHLLRDPAAVVRSMLNFTRTGAPALVETEHQAYEKWLRAVRACAEAERAYGSQVVYRLLYADFMNKPEPTFRSLLDFLQEPYEPACLEPLQHRINSSNIPADFQPADPLTDQDVVEEARRLQQEVMNAPPVVEKSEAAVAELERAFEERVRYIQNVSIYHRRAVARIGQLEQEIEKLKSVRQARSRRWLSWVQRKQACP